MLCGTIPVAQGLQPTPRPPWRRLADAIGVVHARDIDPFDDGLDLVAGVGEKPQGIACFVRDTRNQARDQDLTRDYLSVQLVHLSSSLNRSSQRMAE
jgi:hypothetical protein